MTDVPEVVRVEVGWWVQDRHAAVADVRGDDRAVGKRDRSARVVDVVGLRAGSVVVAVAVQDLRLGDAELLDDRVALLRDRDRVAGGIEERIVGVELRAVDRLHAVAPDDLALWRDDEQPACAPVGDQHVCGQHRRIRALHQV